MPAIRNPSPAKQKKKPHSRPHPPGYIPRPKNAFFVFRSAFYDAHKDDNDANVNQQDLSKQVALIWNEMTEEEREPYARQAEEEKRLHAEMYPDYVYAPGGTSVKGKARAKPTTSSSTRRKSRVDDDDAYTISSRPRRRLAASRPTPATPPASRPSSQSPHMTPGTEALHACENRWQQHSPPHLRSLLDSPFDSSSPLPSPQTPYDSNLMLSSPMPHYASHSQPPAHDESPVSGSGSGLRLPEETPCHLQLNFSYPSPPVSPAGSSTSSTTAGSFVNSNENPWWTLRADGLPVPSHEFYAFGSGTVSRLGLPSSFSSSS